MDSSYAGDALSKIARDIQLGLDAQRSQYLYSEQKDATNAKRNAAQNFQGQQNFAYDTSAPRGGFNIDSILSSITPEMVNQSKNYFNRQLPRSGGM